ncbi:hypothetical protein AB0I28_11580 [Phytomonospora sp. NPDC050363]|uniref:hypothetical protein n=1 Tax=Phytomonospora sp. NPDC050363 TaxID=3155642 RepID=UPI0033ED7100
MSHLARRVLSTAAAVSIVGAALAGCGLTGSDTGAGTGTGAGSDDSPSLDCSDLKEQVDDNAPNATASFDEFEPEKILALASWAAANGKDFEDPDLGTRVTTWGEETPQMEEYEKAVEAEDYDTIEKLEAEGIDDKAVDAYEDNSNKIDDSCPGIGFGVLPV